MQQQTLATPWSLFFSFIYVVYLLFYSPRSALVSVQKDTTVGDQWAASGVQLLGQQEVAELQLSLLDLSTR